MEHGARNIGLGRATNQPFHALLRARTPPLNLADLARRIGCGRCHLVQVLHGQRRGTHTWPLLAKFLTHEEYSLAKAHADAGALCIDIGVRR